MAQIDSVEARKKSKEVRETWLNSIVSGEIDLDTALTYAKSEERDANYVAAIRLSTILEKLPGWSESGASAVLLSNGFKQTDTIKTLRSATIKASRFKSIFELPPPSFASTRPNMPAGWPWQGKLSMLVKVTGQEIPSLEFEQGYGTDDLPVVGRRKTTTGSAIESVTTVPLEEESMEGVNTATGEIEDEVPQWDAPDNDESSLVGEEDIAELFGGTPSKLIDDDEIEAFLK